VILLKSVKEFIVIFGVGALIYSLIEVITRGYTHWTMTLTGGIVFVLIYLVNMKISSNSLILRCAVGCAIITSMEFIVGCIVNRGLHLNVWDYSQEKFNVLGQICPLFSILWFLLCIPATMLAFGIRKKLRA